MDTPAAHVLVFPSPLQGHINCMLHFATGLVATGVHVTFLHTDHNLRRIDSAADTPARLRFLSVPDGLPDDHPRSVHFFLELMVSLWTSGSAAYRALLASLCAPGVAGRDAAGATDASFPPVTCVVADGILPFAIDIADELGVPAIAFRTARECVQLPDVPVRAQASGAWRLASSLSPKAVTSTSRSQQDPVIQLLSPALAEIALHMRDVFPIGPLHAMCSATSAASSLWCEDDGCTAWLDGQADRSVVYLSLGSLAMISANQLTEFLSGLIAAGYPFLWVLRQDMVEASQDAALQEAVRVAGESKARVVPWAPQRDVLRHRAVGCFLTHSGWNSTLEAAVEGVPMVCWPFNFDQQINSRFVGTVWKMGLDMKDVCDRAVVERMVREAMESGEIRESAQALAQKVRRDITDGGSSATEFKRLVRFIRELSTAGNGSRINTQEHE
ncbi:hypothetical protein ACP70R_023010 [Stipagrostis hirtigluma subsp. patula]